MPRRVRRLESGRRVQNSVQSADPVLDRAAHCAVERLERRSLLCGLPHELLIDVPVWSDAIEQQYASSQEGGPDNVSIVWTNRGLASDGFAAAFGASANAGRAVVDAVFTQWGRIIQNFNRSDGTLTLQVNLAIGTGAGFGAAGGPEVSPPPDAKPRLGAISIGRGTITPDVNDSNGWFFDPTPMDNAEFLGTVNHAYNARATNTGQGSDFFSVVNLELAHCLGFISDRNNAGGDYGAYLLEDITDPTGIRDNAEGGGSFGHFQVFNGPNIDHLMTTYNSGDATDLSWGNVIHSAGGGNINFAGQNWRGNQDEGNAIYDGGERLLPSFVVARILGDAYNYTINDPEQFATAHAVLNQSNGQLTIRGSSSATSGDFLAIESSGSDFLCIVDIGEDVAGTGPLAGAGNIDGYFTRIPKSSVNSIVMEGGGGNDIIRVDANDGNPTTISGGGGDDFLDFGFLTRNLSNITASTHVEGGSGNDQIFVYDNNVSVAQTFTITSARFDRPGWGGFSYASDTENHVLTTGTGADTVNVQSTFTGQPVVVASAGGADAVNIGNANGIRSINADVQVQNDPSFTTLQILNGQDTGNRTWEVGISGAFGFLTGMAPANIFWDNADIASIGLLCGSGLDTGLFSRLSETFQLNTTGSNDIITVGQSAAGGLNAITAQLTIDNSPAFTVLTLDDGGDSTSDVVTIDEAGGYNTVSGLAPALIRFDSVDVLTATVITGSALDTVNVPRSDEDLTVSTSGSGDTVNLGNATNGVQSIIAPLKVTNPPSFSTVNINNGPDSLARTATLQNVQIDGSTFGQWTGLAPAPISYKYADLATANVTFGSSSDTVNVRQSQKNLNITTTGGFETVTFGGAADGAQSVLGEITIQNPPAFTTVTVNDANNTTGVVATVDDVLLIGIPNGRLSGFAPANIHWEYNDVTAVTLIHGSGDDTLDVLRHQDQLNVQGTAGSDTVTLGGGPAGMNGLTSGTTVANAGGATALILDDSNDTTGNSILHRVTAPTNAQVSGMLPGLVNYVPGEVTTARIITSVNGNSIVIEETSPLTQVFYDPSSLGDAVDVNVGGVGSAALYTDRDVNPNAVHIGDNGAVYQLAGDFLFRTASLTIDAAGILDLSDGAMVVDYTGSSPLATIQQYITDGYNGGAWNGFGVQSSAAAATAGTALGFGEATDIFTTFPAPFPDTVDDTSILVRYTLDGDANLDRRVNLADFNSLASNFGGTGLRWTLGDFTFDTNVSLADFNLLAGNFGAELGPDGQIERVEFGNVPSPPRSGASDADDTTDDAGSAGLV